MSGVYHIDEGLFQGGDPTGARLDNFGISAVVSLCTTARHPDAHMQVFMEIPDEFFPGIQTWLRSATGVVGVLAQDHVVLIHCQEGVSRSVMLTAAHLMKSRGWSLDRAMETIAASNGGLKPNRRFMQALKDFQDELRW
jgi:hypothetical protein